MILTVEIKNLNVEVTFLTVEVTFLMVTQHFQTFAKHFKILRQQLSQYVLSCVEIPNFGETTFLMLTLFNKKFRHFCFDVKG